MELAHMEEENNPTDGIQGLMFYKLLLLTSIDGTQKKAHSLKSLGKMTLHYSTEAELLEDLEMAKACLDPKRKSISLHQLANMKLRRVQCRKMADKLQPELDATRDLELPERGYFDLTDFYQV